MGFELGHHLGLSSITSTLHIGAHADSPAHYSAQGEGIDRRSLEYYIGPVFLARTDPDCESALGRRIGFKDLSAFSREWIESNPPRGFRFILSTGTFPNPDIWNSNFSSYDPALIERLAEIGVITIGIDTPSIDPETSKELESHQTIAKLNLAVLEGLCLGGVPEGTYTLMAPPLKIEGGDAGPVRALLFDGHLTEKNFGEAANFTWIECEPKPKL